MNCPSCSTDIAKLTPELMAEHEGATVDCPYCDNLLIIQEKRLYEFHSYMNKASDGQWPADGENTFYAEI